MRTLPAIERVSRLQDDLVVAVLELQIKFVVAELCLRVRFTRGDDFMVQLTLDLTIENLQLLVFQIFQILRKRISRSDPQMG